MTLRQYDAIMVHLWALVPYAPPATLRALMWQVECAYDPHLAH
jgi:hypothetical protein